MPEEKILDKMHKRDSKLNKIFISIVIVLFVLTLMSILPKSNPYSINKVANRVVNIPYLGGTDLGSTINDTKEIDTQNRTITQYDDNYCGEYSNETLLITNIINFTIQTNTTELNYTFTAINSTTILNWSLNDTSIMNIDGSGFMINITALDFINKFWLNINVTDVDGLNATGIFWVDVTAKRIITLETFKYEEERSDFTKYLGILMVILGLFSGYSAGTSFKGV
jgi:hypothetical protein